MGYAHLLAEQVWQIAYNKNWTHYQPALKRKVYKLKPIIKIIFKSRSDVPFL